ncbi:MAG TPA: hypothetical protein VGW77_22700 [Candidatus Binatia bacterium]|nr:hypothetical protein [Candidatus Binatia bacterium]
MSERQACPVGRLRTDPSQSQTDKKHDGYHALSDTGLLMPVAVDQQTEVG